MQLMVGILLAIFQVVKTPRELFPVPNPDDLAPLVPKTNSFEAEIDWRGALWITGYPLLNRSVDTWAHPAARTC